MEGKTYGYNENWDNVECTICGRAFRIEDGWIVDDQAAWGVGEPCPDCGEPLGYYTLVPPMTEEERSLVPGA